MVNINITYDGNLNCTLTHGPSGAKVLTTAPVDNGGTGDKFSPTDLVAGALAACMATIMGKVADRKDYSLEGMNITVGKEMSASPRRIARLTVTIDVPLPASHPDKELLVNAAMTCPVHGSLHPDIIVDLSWNWIG